jgi:hypothetical protein
VAKAKEAALLAVGVVLGIISLFVSSSHVDFRGFGATSWGYPLAWHYEADLTIGGVSVFGLYLGSVNWGDFGKDLLFWTVVWVALVEASSHIVLPYLSRRLRLRRLGRSARPALEYDRLSDGSKPNDGDNPWRTPG